MGTLCILNRNCEGSEHLVIPEFLPSLMTAWAVVKLLSKTHLLGVLYL